MEIKLRFIYDHLGWGELVGFGYPIGYTDVNNMCPEFHYRSRTGSIDRNGKLVNALPIGVWYIIDKPVSTEEEAMKITPGNGWKVRLYDQFRKYTSYLIHPDSGKPGTRGCIGIQGEALDLKQYLTLVLNKQKEVKVFINVNPVV